MDSWQKTRADFDRKYRRTEQSVLCLHMFTLSVILLGILGCIGSVGYIVIWYLTQ